MPAQVIEEISGAEPVPEPVGERLTWKATVVDWLQFIRSALFNGMVIAAILAVVLVTAKDILRQPVIIEQFGLPESLSQRGLSGTVTANRVWDAMIEIQNAAGTQKETRSVLAESRQLDVVEPGTGVSLKNASQMMRELFGIEQTRIAGEVICGTDRCDWDDLNIRLRVFSEGRMHVIDSGPTGDRRPEALFHELALQALEIVDPYIVAAYRFSSLEDRAEAVKIANHLVDSGHPQAAWAANLLGNHEQANGRHLAAIDWFERAVRMSYDLGQRDFALPHYGKGNSLLALNRNLEALAAFEQSIALDPDFSLPHFGKGHALMALKQFQDAAPVFRNAVRMEPSQAAHWSALGNALQVIEGPEVALEHLRRAVRLDEEFVPARGALGKVLVDLNRPKEALENLNFAIDRDPSFTLARLALGKALLDLGENGAAVRQLKIATVLDAESAVAWDRLAAALTVTGDLAGAASAAEKALVLDPKLKTEVGSVVLANFSNNLTLPRFLRPGN